MTLRLDATALSDSDSLRLAEYGMIGAIAQWCECLHGKSPLVKSLELLGTGVDAEAVAIVRFSRSGASDSRPVCWDRAPEDVRGGRLHSGYARSLLGAYFDAARPGSLWYRSMLDDTSPDLVDFHAARILRELVVIPLETNDRHIDMLEIHFAERLRNFQQLLLNTLAPVLSRNWRNRTQGLFTETVLRRAEQRRSATLDKPILSTDNPARLSRAEYRVGLMLSRGMSLEDVKAELNIRESTLRTHLGNLYAKTRVSNLSELVFLLVSASPIGSRDKGNAARLA